MARTIRTLSVAGLAVFASSLLFTDLTAQQSTQSSVPDAPSAAKPPANFPTNVKPQPASPPEKADTAAEPSAAESGAAPATSAVPMPTSRARRPDEDSLDDYRIRVGVNTVNVPVTVKDRDGNLVEGLTRKDFTIYEDGAEQRINFFTSESFPLSAAVVIDQGMPATAMRQVNQTLHSITGAFSQYDEVALYTYSNVVHSVASFRAANDALTQTLESTKRVGRSGGVPVTGGPMAAGPTVNGRPFDPGQPHVVTPVREASVLNDAVLMAALDLSKRDRARRRVIFIISDGKEEGSNATYSEVLKVLLTNEITVYALGVDAAAIPGWEELGRIKLVGQAQGNILPKYVSATGGGFIAGATREAIDKAYGRLAGQSRNQYTLAYSTSATASTSYRSIEVLVKRPNVRVIARDGYYPLPRKPLGAAPAEPPK